MFKSGQTCVMVWGAFIGFDKISLVIMALRERIIVHFTQKVYEGILSGFYFMNDEPHELTLMEANAPIHRSKYLESWR